MLKPFDLMTWVESVLDQVPVLIVASLSVKRDNLGFFILFSAFKPQKLRVVPKLSELCHGFWL